MIWLHLLAAAPTPVPTPPAYTGNPDLVTPTWIGFAVTFAIAAIVIVLVLDMVRRIRRVRYRAEVRDKLDAEQAAEAEERANREGPPRP